MKMNASKFFWEFFVFIGLIQLGQSADNPNGGSFGNVAFNSVYSIGWIVTENGTIWMHLELNAKSWVGIGFHSPGSSDTGMTKADFVIATFDSNGEVTVQDYYADSDNNGYTQPVTDVSVGGTDDILSYSGILYLLEPSDHEAFQNGGLTTVTFERKLFTGDSKDNIIGNTSQLVIWARGNPSSSNPNSFGYHGSSTDNRGSLNMNFFTGETSSVEDDLPLWHGSLMVISFGFCMTFGIFVAKFLKEYVYWWFPLHILIMMIAVITALCGFGIAIDMTDGDHFSNVHSWFGISTLLFAIIAPTGGIAAHLVFDERRAKIPIWPDQIHWWTGRITVVLSFVTIFLGLRQYGASKALQAAFGGWAIFCIFLYFAIVALGHNFPVVRKLFG